MNLQATPLDSVADLIIHATCDDVMRAVMAKLELDIPPFRLHRYVNVGHRTLPTGARRFHINGTTRTVPRSMMLTVSHHSKP